MTSSFHYGCVHSVPVCTRWVPAYLLPYFREAWASLMKHLGPLPLLVSAGLLLGCAGVKQTASPTGAGGGSGASTGSGGSNGSGGTTPPPPGCNGPCDDFGGGPFGPDGTSGSVPSGAAQVFGGSGSGSGGPCLFEPQDGTLLPNNWLRPRFSWTATGDLYELRVSGGNQAEDLVVYTDKTSWTMPASMWRALAIDSQDVALAVKIRSSSHGGAPSTGTSAAFSIAPVGASGNLVYWSPTGSTNAGTGTVGNTLLSGMSVGGESVTQVLIPTDVGKNGTWNTMDVAYNKRAVTCIGCHTSTPDGNFIAFNDAYPWGGVLASGQPGQMGSSPSDVPSLGAAGYNAFIQPWLGITTFSINHWSANDYIAVAPLGTCGSGAPCSSGSSVDGDQQPGLAWFDLSSSSSYTGMADPATTLKGTGWNWIYPPDTAKSKYAAAPSWSHLPSDDFIVFTMTSNVKSGRLGTGTAHLYKVPYSMKAAQTPVAIPGDGSDPAYAQYYGTLSADDAYIVYDRIPAGIAAVNHANLDKSATGCNPSPCVWEGMYMQPQTELFVIPTPGGTATRLAANDPPQCPGQMVSPGINNTWAKWSPDVAMAPNGDLYYWVIFSSWRQGMVDSNGSPIAQLFMTVIVRTELGLHTYPAVYLWNQRPDVSNFTPAWDVFKIGSVG